MCLVSVDVYFVSEHVSLTYINRIHNYDITDFYSLISMQVFSADTFTL